MGGGGGVDMGGGSPFSRRSGTTVSDSETNRLTLTFKAISAFVITFITIIGVITLTARERSVKMKVQQRQLQQGQTPHYDHELTRGSAEDLIVQEVL